MEQTMQSLLHYDAGMVMGQLEDLIRQQFNGIVYLKPEHDSKLSSQVSSQGCIVAFHQGRLNYCGQKIPTKNDFVQALCKKLNPNIANVAIHYVLEKGAQLSLGSILDQLVRVRVFTWEQVEVLLQLQAIQLLDAIQTLPGSIQFDPHTSFHLEPDQSCFELSWAKIRDALQKREQRWQDLSAHLPSRYVVPIRLVQAELDAVEVLSDSAPLQAIYQAVDGQRSLLDIANLLERDPLDVAQSLVACLQQGIVTLDPSLLPRSQATPGQLTVLTVDDSPIVQAMLKRTLADHYRVLTAGNGASALELLATESVHLAILDVTMPDVNGLDLCHLIRQMPEYKELPILMLTARDGYADRLKGFIAGSTQYLTKPVEPAKLLKIIQSCLQAQMA